MLKNLEVELKQKCQNGQKLLVPFITGGIQGWEETLQAFEDVGADAVEVGIPFSDAVMDGPIICEANDIALSAGTTPDNIFKKVAELKLKVPVIAMTYYNIAYRRGLANFSADLKTYSFSGGILADMPFEASSNWLEAGRQAEIATILLAAPTASDDRLERIATSSTGFVYAVGLLGVTGEQETLATSATEIAKRLKQVTDTPVLVGVGISTPEQAAKAVEVADGVIVGSVLVKKLLANKSPKKTAKLLAEFKKALN